MKNYQFTAHIGKDQHTGLYYGIVPNLQGAHTQAETLDELHKNLQEVVKLCIEEMTPDERGEISEFVGLQQISIAV